MVISAGKMAARQRKVGDVKVDCTAIVLGPLGVVLSRIVGVMIADPATATTNRWRMRREERVVERAGSTCSG